MKTQTTQFGQTRQGGTVKWFNNLRGYGFIEADSGGDDVYAHYSDIEGQRAWRSLYEGDRVTFEIDEGEEKGRRAKKIRRSR